jgi:hypothetical protein
LRDDRPSVRFFEGLVRLPDHNRVIPKSIVSRELSPRFSSLFRYYSLQKSPRCHSRFSLPILLKAVGHSLLLEDCSSVEVIVVHSSPETTGVKTFCVVEIMYLLWKCRPAPTRTAAPLIPCWPHDSYAFALSRFTQVPRKALVHHSKFGAGRGKLSMLELRWEGTTTENALYMLVLTELKIGGRTLRFT